MVFLRRYKLKTDTRAYPRYFSYRNKVSSVFSRVKRLLETNDLLGLLEDRQSTWNTIKDDVEKCIGTRSSICLFVLVSASSDLDVIRDKLFRDKTVFEENKRTRNLPREEVEVEDLDLESYVETVDTASDGEIIISSIRETEEEVVLIEKINRFLRIRENNSIIYNITSDRSSLFRDWANKESSGQKILCQNVEYLLEKNVINLLEDILGIIGCLVPRKDDSHMDIGSIVDGVVSCLNASFDNLTFLKELRPDNFDEELSPNETEKFHFAVMSTLERKTKFKFQVLMSKKLGIKESFIHEFMNNCGFDFENKFSRGIKIGVLPSFPIEHGLKELKDAFKNLSVCCQDLCRKLIPEAKDFVLKKYVALNTLKKIQFEIFGILRTNSRCRTVKLPKVIQVSDRLLDDLLGLEFVEGCGCLYGIMTITVSVELSSEQREQIRELIKTHKFYQEYEVNVKLAVKEHGPIIEHGNGIVSEFTQGGREKFVRDKKIDEGNIDQNFIKGTLGCFIEPVTGGGLYAVTCYHCIQEEYFEKDIKVQMEQLRNFDDLGVRSYWLYDKYTLDIGLIKVHEHMILRCDKTMVKEDELMKSLDWKFWKKSYDSDLSGLQVYKKGLVDFTRGIIAGYDFKTKSMKELQESGFDEHFNIFITSRPGEYGDTSTSDSQNFSEDGDSGSVVCIENIPEDADEPSIVLVISLLCGSITLKNNDNLDIPPETYSYSCHLRGLLDELVKQRGCPEMREAIEEKT